MSRVSYLVLVCLAVPVWTAGCGSGQVVAPEVRNPRAPILLVVFDAASARYFGVYGDPHDTSPRIDRVALDSVVFTRAYSQTATTGPTVVCLLTGVRRTTHRVGPRPLPENLKTAAELLAEHGVVFSAVIGNPHAGETRLDFDRGAHRWIQAYRRWIPGRDLQRLGMSRFKVATPEDVNFRVFELLPDLGDATLTYIHYLQPHIPYDPPPEYLEAFDADTSVTWKELDAAANSANAKQQASEETIALLEARYRANIRYLDDGFGALIDRLVEDGTYDETLIVLTADHGDAFFGHGQFGHNTTLYDDMTRVPLLIKFPKADGVEPRRIDVLVETIDLLPTLFDYMGLPMPDQFEGDSLWPVIGGERPAPGFDEALLATTRLHRRALIEGDLKYIVHRNRPGELYDLRSDPEEKVNLIDTRRDTVKRLHKKLLSLSRPSIEPAPATGKPPEMDEEVKRLLETLGYADGVASDEIPEPPAD